MREGKDDKLTINHIRDLIDTIAVMMTKTNRLQL